MPPVSKRLISPKIQKNIEELLVKAVGKVGKKYEILPFLSDLLTPTERVMIAKRLAIAFLLLRKDYDQREIAKVLKVSTSTVARVNFVLHTQGRGYRDVIEKILKEEAFKTVLNELYEGLTPLPPKGANWGEWKKSRRERREDIKMF